MPASRCAWRWTPCGNDALTNASGSFSYLAPPPSWYEDRTTRHASETTVKAKTSGGSVLVHMRVGFAS